MSDEALWEREMAERSRKSKGFSWQLGPELEIPQSFLQLLTKKQRQYFSHYIKGMQIKDIAAMYGVCPSVVSRTVTRAKKRLAQALDLSLALAPRPED